jgi:NitT/TauT family transport system ATP-binding protein
VEMKEPGLEIVHLSKMFTSSDGSSISALKDINLRVENGKFTSMIGPSGCGKTTLLRIIAGLEDSSEGKVLLDGEEVSEPGQQVGLVFQEYALFPWRTVLGNVEFGLEIKGVSKKERRERALQYILTIGLEGFEDKYPKELSSGMKQRVGIARTLINKPKVLLMDEPFGSLDDQTRNNLQTHLLEIWIEAKRTILFVTHNIDEAIFLGQSIICFSSRPGTIKKALEVDLRYPRDRTDMEFNRYRKELQNFFRTETGWGEGRKN